MIYLLYNLNLFYSYSLKLMVHSQTLTMIVCSESKLKITSFAITYDIMKLCEVGTNLDHSFKNMTFSPENPCCYLILLL